MANHRLRTVLQHLCQRFRPPEGGALPDGHLLERWTRQRDEAAFELLLRRHGPMVFGVCRRVLGHTQDAEDAFQATFLILVRRAGSIANRAALGGWLHKVAFRVALRARNRAAGQSPVLDNPDLLAGDSRDDGGWSDIRPVLDEEVNRLPARYRDTFILCYFEGKSNEEAARTLGCPVGTVQSRLSRAREQLRARLTRRGLAPGAAGLAAVLSARTASAWVPSKLVSASLNFARAAGTGPGAGTIPAPITTLCKGVLQAMFLTKLKIAVSILVAVALLGGLGGWLGSHPADAQEGQPGSTPLEVVLAGEPGETWKEQPALTWPEAPVSGLAFSPDGRYLVTGTADGKVRFWDPQTGKATTEPAGAGEKVTHLRFSADGQSLGIIAKTNPSDFHLVETAGGLLLLAQPKEPRKTAALSPDGKTLAVAPGDQQVRFVDVKSLKEVRSIQDQTGKIEALTFTPDGRVLITGGDKSVRLWDAATGKQIALINRPGQVQSLAASPDGKLVAVAGDPGTVWLVDTATGQPLRSLQGHQKVIAVVLFSPDGRLLASGGEDKTIRIWDVRDGKQIFLGRHAGPVKTLAFSPDGKTLVSGGEDKVIRVWSGLKDVVQLKVTTVLARPGSGADRLAKLVDELIRQKKTNRECAEALYLATLARYPTDGELKFMLQQFGKADQNRETALENILFALTSTKEFHANVLALQERDPHQSLKSKGE